MVRRHIQRELLKAREVEALAAHARDPSNTRARALLINNLLDRPCDQVEVLERSGYDFANPSFDCMGMPMMP